MTIFSFIFLLLMKKYNTYLKNVNYFLDYVAKSFQFYNGEIFYKTDP